MKAIASDFDNTLFFYDGMRENDLKAIKELQRQGNLFGVCTGRDISGIRTPSKDYDISYDFYICLSGSVIADSDLKIIMQKRIPFKTVRMLRNYVNENVHMSFNHGGEMYHLDKLRLRNYHGTYLDSIDDVDFKEVDGCSFHYPDGHIKEAKIMIDKINHDFSDEICAYQNNEHIDICAKGCSKGKGIDIIKEYYGIDKMYAIGDSFNDLPMFSHVDESFTFDYASDLVQKQASHIVQNMNQAIEILLGNEEKI